MMPLVLCSGMLKTLTIRGGSAAVGTSRVNTNMDQAFLVTSSGLRFTFVPCFRGGPKGWIRTFCKTCSLWQRLVISTHRFRDGAKGELNRFCLRCLPEKFLWN